MRLPKPARVRDEQYLAWIRTQPCLLAMREVGGCRAQVEAHHVPPRGGGKVGSKTDDRRTVPLCSEGHAIYHQVGRRLFERDFLCGDLETQIRLLNLRYDEIHPKKSGVVPRVRLPKIPQLKSITVSCSCGETHKIPRSKCVWMSSFVKGDYYEYRCIRTGKMTGVGA